MGTAVGFSTSPGFRRLDLLMHVVNNLLGYGSGVKRRRPSQGFEADAMRHLEMVEATFFSKLRKERGAGEERR